MNLFAEGSKKETSSNVETFFMDLPEQVASQIHRHTFEYEHRLGVGDGNIQAFTWEVESPSLVNSKHKGNLDPEDTGTFVPVKLALRIKNQSGDQDFDLQFAQIAFYRSVSHIYESDVLEFQREFQVLEGTYQNNEALDLAVANSYRVNGVSGRLRLEMGADLKGTSSSNEAQWSFYNDVYMGFGISRRAHSQDWQGGLESEFCIGAIRRKGLHTLNAKGCLGRQDIGSDYIDVDSLELAYQKRGARLRFVGRAEVQSLNGQDSTSNGILSVEVLAPRHPGDSGQGLMDFRSPMSKLPKP